MLENENLTTDSVDSPSAASGNVNPGNAEFELDLSNDALVSYAKANGESVDFLGEDEVSEPQEAPVEEPVEEELAETTSDESDIEVEETTEEEHKADLEESPDVDIDVLSISDLADQVGKLEINGKEYTPAQLKSILGQEESAGTKVREATATLKAAEERLATVEAREKLIQERVVADKNVVQMTAIQNDYAQMNEALNKARAEGDAYEITILTDKINQAAAKYNSLQQQVAETRTQEHSQRVANAEKALREKGLGYLLEDTPQATAWKAYASKSLSAEEVTMAATTPAFAEAIEKARRWDEANGKEGKKLVNKKVALKPSGDKRVSKQKNNLVDKINAGKASPAEIERFVLEQGRSMF